MTSLEKQIAQTELDNKLMMENIRIGKAARKGQNRNTVNKMTPVDEELVKEYNSQFPKGFESIDQQTGRKRYTKFLLPADKPELEQEDADLVPEPSEAEIESKKRERQNWIHEITEREKHVHDLRTFLIRLKRDADEGKISIEKFEMESELIYLEIDDQKSRINDLNTRLMRLDSAFNNLVNLKKDNEAKRAKTRQHNDLLLKKYKDELNILNKGAFTTEPLPGESQEDYYNRLQQNAEIEAPEDDLEQAKLLLLRKFRDYLKEIIRDPVKIDTISNTLNNEQKLYFMKVFPHFKAKFIKIYGVNNQLLTATEIVQSILTFIERDGYGEDTNVFSSEPQVEENIPIFSPKTRDQIQQALKAKYTAIDDIRDRVRQFQEEGNPYFSNVVIEKKGKRANTVKYVPKDELVRDISRSIERQMKDLNVPYDEVGFGLSREQIPEYAKFGKILIQVQKLYYKNILCVKHHNKLSIAGVKNTKVSDKFVKIIMCMLENIKPTISEINGLSTSEKQLYDHVIYLGGLNKMMPHNNDKTISDLKKRMKLIEGEIATGNNSPLLKDELYYICHTLKNFNVLSLNELKKYLAQF